MVATQQQVSRLILLIMLVNRLSLPFVTHFHFRKPYGWESETIQRHTDLFGLGQDSGLKDVWWCGWSLSPWSGIHNQYIGGRLEAFGLWPTWEPCSASQRTSLVSQTDHELGVTWHDGVTNTCFWAYGNATWHPRSVSQNPGAEVYEGQWKLDKAHGEGECAWIVCRVAKNDGRFAWKWEIHRFTPQNFNWKNLVTRW